MTVTVGVIDYGAGNIANVIGAFESQGIDATLATSSFSLDNFSHLVLPGVGAFNYGIKNLRNRNLADELLSLVAKERPVLGICLGMQLFAESGYENGPSVGLGLLKGVVAHLRALGEVRPQGRIPHTGWSSLQPTDGSPLARFSVPRTAYFNHSYFLAGARTSQIIATTSFGGFLIPAVVKSGSLLATQFHPEKSGKEGLKFLADWAKNPP